MTYKKTFSLGDVVLPNNIFYAPLAGCSDFPFRRMSARYKPGIMWCEMVKMDALVRFDPGTFHLLDYDASMHPIGAQLCGSKEEFAAPAAKIIEDLGFAAVDLNCGCPVDKVTKDGSGSGLLKNPDKIGTLIANMVAAVKIPVTVKIRAGWDEDTIVAGEITKIAEQAGAKAIAIHGRTRKQAYKGPANWDYIRACKEAATTIKVIGNGDLFSPEDVERMYEQTKCDAFLISRGTLGNPWMIEDIYNYFEKNYTPKTFADRLQALKDHYKEIIAYHNDKKTIIDMRRIGCWYLKQAKAFRQQVAKASSLEEIDTLLEEISNQEALFGG